MTMVCKDETRGAFPFIKRPILIYRKLFDFPQIALDRCLNFGHLFEGTRPRSELEKKTNLGLHDFIVSDSPLVIDNLSIWMPLM